jgi:hypothetical protein
MSFLPLFTEKKTRVYENILKFRTLNHTIRTWVERSKEEPDEHTDFLEINEYISGKRKAIDAQPAVATAEDLCKRFPRICAIEVMNGSDNEGVLLYPRWP